MTKLEEMIKINYKKAQELIEECNGAIENLAPVDMLRLSEHIDKWA